MKVCDFEIDYSSGLFNCCFEHISECKDFARAGSRIECEHCGLTMELRKNNKGKLMWCRLYA